MKNLHSFVLYSAGCLTLLSAETASAQREPVQTQVQSQANFAQVGASATAIPATAQPAAQPVLPQAAPAAPMPRTVTAMPGQTYVMVDPATGAQVPMLTYAPIVRQRPATLPYVEGAPVPRGYMLEEYHSRGLIISGAVTLGVLYALSLSVASTNDFSGADGWLAVPVIGPFGWLATKKDTCVSSTYSTYCSSNNDPGNRTMVMFDGIGQVAGAALLTAGLAITRKHLVLVEQDVIVAPYATSTGSGLRLIGTF